MSNGIVHPVDFDRFEAFLLLRVRSRQSEFPRANGRYSPGLLPLQSFSLSTLGTSNPPWLGQNTRPGPKTRTRDAEDRDPRRRVRLPGYR